VVLAGLGAGALTLHSPASHTFTIPRPPAQNAIDLIQQRFPQACRRAATQFIQLSSSTSYVRHAVSVARPQSGLRHSGTQMLTASSRSCDCP